MHNARVIVILVLGLGLWVPGATAQLASDSGVPDLARAQDYSAHRVSSTNADPLSNDDSLRPIPGETVVLADLEGPGVVTHIWLTVAAADYGWPRLLRLRIYYDGSPVPSVDAPVGDFFGVGLGLESPLESLAIRDSSSGRSRNSYWPMPFAKSCRITVTNEGSRRVSNLYYHVDYRKVPELPADTRYFHARYHQELPVVAGRFYPVLEIDGEGHYVGTVFSVVQAEPGWFGEGDEWIFVDGAAEPSIIGTGTEDYFNDAWSLRVDTGPYAGVTVAEGTGLGARMSAYRWHPSRPDPLPLTAAIRLRAQRVDLQPRRVGAVGLRRTRRPFLVGGLLVSEGRGPEPPARTVRDGPAAARQCHPVRDRGRRGRHHHRGRSGDDPPRALLGQGRGAL